MIIQAETFQAVEINAAGGCAKGTVVVCFDKDTKAVPALKIRDIIIARGFGGRYQTSAKVWPATITLDLKTGHEFANFGRDDRSGRFNKLRGIFLL
jgi:hypothetical protein